MIAIHRFHRFPLLAIGQVGVDIQRDLQIRVAENFWVELTSTPALYSMVAYVWRI